MYAIRLLIRYIEHYGAIHVASLNLPTVWHYKLYVDSPGRLRIRIEYKENKYPKLSYSEARQRFVRQCAEQRCIPITYGHIEWLRRHIKRNNDGGTLDPHDRVAVEILINLAELQRRGNTDAAWYEVIGNPKRYRMPEFDRWISIPNQQTGELEEYYIPRFDGRTAADALNERNPRRLLRILEAAGDYSLTQWQRKHNAMPVSNVIYYRYINPDPAIPPLSPGLHYEIATEQLE